LEKHGENYPKAYKGKVLKGDIEDKTLTNEGEFWPFAQDGMFDPTKNRFDATKKHKY
jgi:hypothetical protein